MAEQRALFSESWHRVASQRLRLRPSVTIRRQRFRGESWHVARDGFNNQFFRFRPEAYSFVARLDGTRTIEEIWLTCLERDTDRAPGQGEILSILSQLYHANLIVSDVPADTERLFERHQKRIRQEIKSQVFGVFFLRVRLFDPDELLNRLRPVLRWLLTPAAAIVWAAVVIAGLATVFGDWDRASDQTQRILEPGNLLLLYLAFAGTKLVHEFGHACAVKKLGGEVHAMGVTFLVFTPIPYVDATAAWAFRERWKRIAVGLAGMIPELFLASLAVFVWSGTGPGVLNSLAYNVMIVASVSTLLFNLNPLLRFDGYYVLADSTDSPNLQPRAVREWLHLVEKYVFKGIFIESPARSRAEEWWLSIYGVLSWSYRLFVTVSIILLVANRYFGIGLLAGVVTFVGSFVMPAVGAVTYLIHEPRIQRVRHRAWAISCAALALILVLLGVVPFPRHFRAPGVIRAAGSAEIVMPVDGWIRSFAVRSPADVRAGEPLARLESPELGFLLVEAQADLDKVKAREREVMVSLPAAIEPVRRRLQASEAQHAKLAHDREALDFRAPVAGRWVSPRADAMEGIWLPRGMPIGEIVGEGPAWNFYAVVSEEYSGELFGGGLRGATIRFPGSAGSELQAASLRIVPGRQDILPSPALSWPAGGPVKVHLEDRNSVQTVEPFFLVVAQVPGPDASRPLRQPALFWQGRTGIIRFDLPWSPLLVQWAREFRQLLQRRYQV